MQILDKQLDKKVNVVSKKLGINKKQFINASVSAYLNNFHNAMNLKKELEMWDMLSAISMRRNNF